MLDHFHDHDHGRPSPAARPDAASPQALTHAERVQRDYLRARLERERQELVSRWGRALDALKAGASPEGAHWAQDFRRWAAAIRLLDARIDATR